MSDVFVQRVGGVHSADLAVTVDRALDLQGRGRAHGKEDGGNNLWAVLLDRVDGLVARLLQSKG